MLERHSQQVRAVHPEAGSTFHPRAIEMGEAMRDICALGHGCGFRDLAGAGFTAAEIEQHHDAADRYATEVSTKQITAAPDLLVDMVIKAREAIPNCLPLPKGARETQSLFVAWGHYCACRSALSIDHWDGQRERCIAALTAYFRKTPAGEAVIKHVVQSVAHALIAPRKVVAQ